MNQRIFVCVNGTSKLQKELYRKKFARTISVLSDPQVETFVGIRASNELRRSKDQMKTFEVVYIFDDPNRKLPWEGKREKHNLIVNLIDIDTIPAEANKVTTYFDHIFFRHPKLVIKYRQDSHDRHDGDGSHGDPKIIFHSSSDWFDPLIIEDCITLSEIDGHAQFISDLTDIVRNNYFSLLCQSKEWNDEHERSIQERRLERRRLEEEETLKKIPVNLTIMVRGKIMNLEITAFTSVREIEDMIEGVLKLYVNGTEVKIEPTDRLAVVYKNIIKEGESLKIPLLVVDVAGE